MKTPIFQTDVKVTDLTKKNLFGFADILKKSNVTGFAFKKVNLVYLLKYFLQTR